MTHEELKELALSLTTEGGKKYEAAASTLTEKDKKKLIALLLQRNAEEMATFKEELKELRKEIEATRRVKEEAEALLLR